MGDDSKAEGTDEALQTSNTSADISSFLFFVEDILVRAEREVRENGVESEDHCENMTVVPNRARATTHAPSMQLVLV